MVVLVTTHDCFHYTGEIEFAFGDDGWVGFVGREEGDVAFGVLVIFECPFVVDFCDDNVAVFWCGAASDDDHVTRMNAGVDHGVTGNAQHKTVAFVLFFTEKPAANGNGFGFFFRMGWETGLDGTE